MNHLPELPRSHARIMPPWILSYSWPTPQRWCGPMSDWSDVEAQRVKTLGPAVLEPVTKAWRPRSEAQRRTRPRCPSRLNG